MAEKPIDERTFTDQEVREILKRAVESEASRALVKVEGLSLAALKTIGEEVGIDPARLEEAARSVAREAGNQPSRILGGPILLNFERRVEGEFEPEDTPEILSLIRRITGHQGEIAEIHGSLEWSAKTESGERHVTLSSRDGSTTIRSSANLSGVAILTYLPAGLVGSIISLLGLVTFLKKGSDVGLIVFLAVVPIMYGALRTLFGKITGAESRKLQEVVEELARLTAGSGE